MNRKLIAIAIVVVLAGIGSWFYVEKTAQAPVVTETSVGESPMLEGQTTETEMGTYDYRCDDGSQFSAIPANDMALITLVAGDGSAFGTVTLASTPSAAGARFEGSGFVFIGAGEEVQLIEMGGKTRACEPIPRGDMAPWNWGDAGEGGGVKQDLVLVVSESIVGTWQSNDDPKFIREFRSNGTSVDTYDGQVVLYSSWSIFTKDKPLTSSFPLKTDTTYLEVRQSTDASEHLYFEIVRLTPETLEAIYLGLGNTLTFMRI